MKKFAKILVVALTVCLIVGVMAVSASAAAVTIDGATSGTVNETAFNLTANGNAYKHGCCELSNNAIWYDGAEYYYNDTFKGTHSKDAFFMNNGSPVKHGDTYCTAGGILANNYSNVATKASTLKYVTTDFDFWSDAYLVEHIDEETGEVSYTFDRTLESGSSLAYSNGVVLSLYINGKNYPKLAYFVKDSEGAWYLSENNKYEQGGDDIPLATVKGEKNHVTYLDTGSTMMIFVNGVYLTSYSAGFNNATTNHYMVGLSPCNQTLETADKNHFSIKTSATTQRTYSNDYKLDDSKFGIEKYLSEGDYTKNLISCVDTYYNANYDYATFTYKDFEGKTIRTYDYEISKELPKFEYKVDLNNGWYDVKINSWKLEADSQAIAAGGTYTLVPDDFEIISDLTVKFNLSLSTKFFPYFYVPVPDENIGVSNIIVKDIATTESVKSKEGTVEIDGKQYYSYKMATYGAYGPASKVNGSFTFTVKYQDKTQTLTKSTGNKALFTYVSDVATKYGHGTEETKLALSLLRFVNESYKVWKSGNANGYDAANNVLNKHNSCDCALAAAADLAKPSVEEGLDASALNTKGYLISYVIASAAGEPTPRIVIDVPKAEAEKGITITATLTGVKSDNTYGEVTVEFEKKSTDGDIVKYESVEATLDIFNLAEVMEFKVEYSNGDEAIKGTSSLAKYINGLGDDNAFLNVSKAIYAFAEAAKEFKLEEKAAQ